MDRHLEAVTGVTAQYIEFKNAYLPQLRLTLSNVTGEFSSTDLNTVDPMT